MTSKEKAKSKLIVKCTSSKDENPIIISQEDYSELFNVLNKLVNKYGFVFEGGGFYIDGNLNKIEK
jgi:predicted nucleic acid-binding Zn ribbon protein